MAHLPPVTARACRACPWLRTSLPGHLGPLTAEEWVAIGHSDAPVACHTTIVVTDESGEGDWSDPQMRQCAGAAQYRTNVLKSPRDPEVATAPSRDVESVFAWGREFIAHHDKKLPASP